MASQSNSVTLKFWAGGVNSLLHPSDIGQTEYAWAENTVNRGGIIQTRPGFNFLSSIVGKNLQGMAAFTPHASTARLVVAVDGSLYTGSWPKFEFTKIDGADFNPAAKIVNMCECLQSVRRRNDGSLEVIEPVKVLMVCDGESSMIAWDGVSAKKMNTSGPEFQAPSGLWMVWNASRLWIGSGSKVRVSDIGNPTSFAEDQALATRSNFELPDTITGMIETANQRGLLVFTQRTTTVFQSYIRDRASWSSTPDFQKLVFPGIGCDAGRTACNQYGLTYWHSLLGLVSLDAAMNSDHTSRLLPIDGQMMRSKRNLSPDMSGACAVACDNLLLVSVPSGGKRNEHTWVLDQSPIESLGGSQTAWAGIWTGIRPAQWVEAYLGGQKRLYAISYDRTPANNTHIHLWEAMRNVRKDAGGRIACQFQTGIIASERFISVKYAEFDVVEMLGDVSLKVFVGGTRGPWMQLGEFELRAEEGSIGSDLQKIITTSSLLQAHKPQSRTLRTKEFNSQDLECSPEYSGKRPGDDKGFAMLFEWRGRMGIHNIRLTYGEPAAPESDTGGCSVSEASKLLVVTEGGEVLK